MSEFIHHKKQFQIIPWQEEFLPALLDMAVKEGRLEQALFIFPHSRPARYLQKIIQDDIRITKPCLLPEILPIHAVFQKIRNGIMTPAINAGRLDQIGLLLECARAEQIALPGILPSILPGILDDAQAFLPWGARLADLFEDCFIHGIKPVNFNHLEDELAPYAASLLGRLANLHKSYMDALVRRNWTTSGLNAFQILEKLQTKHFDNNFEDILNQKFVQGRRIYIAGFYSPTGSENILFHKLWSAYGAVIVCHADVGLLNASGSNKAHWSCAGIAKWCAGWKSSFNLAGKTGADTGRQHITYYAGYDLHSQLQALRLIMDSSKISEDEGGCAIILPDTKLLLPVLHHIRDKDLNISMGYPLEKTALNRLLENVLALQENKRLQDTPGYYWKDCIRLIRHPYIKMLSLGLKDSENSTFSELWRDYLYRLEKKLREGRRFIDLSSLMREVALSLETNIHREQLQQFVDKLAEILLKSWENLHSIGDVAGALNKLCSLMSEQGTELWQRFPLDAECLFRFMQSIMPELNFSALRNEKLSSKVMFSILRRLIMEERVAFEADPLTATQIMGLLESRLLSFKQVFILEATDDLLPGGTQNDPLLPDSLRQELGLPDIFRRQQMSAYYFYRLLAGAEQIHLFWEEGVEQKGLQDAKKLKSRFIEELLWQEEQKAGRILKPEKSNGPLKLLASGSGNVKNADRLITVSGTVRDALNASILNNGRGLSASRLSRFLTCPLSFYYQESARIKPVKEVAEGDDPVETGELLHKVFAAYYTPKLGRVLNKNEQSHTELINCFRHILQQSSILNTFPQDALVFLRKRAPAQLHKYLDAQPEQTRIIALEAEVNAAISTIDGTEFRLTGRLDRIDERDCAEYEIIDTDEMQAHDKDQTEHNQKALIVLDYKTGKVNPPQAGFWVDSSLWQNIQTALLKPEENYQELLSNIADGLNSNIQLPLYLYLLRHGKLNQQQNNVCKNIEHTRNVCNAAWIGLGSSGKEYALLPDTLSQRELTEILDQKIPGLLAFILGSIKNSQTFAVRRGAHCSYCPYAAMCRITETGQHP